MNATIGTSTRSGRRITAVAIACHQPVPDASGCKERHAAAPEVGTEDREERGKEREAVEHGARDDDRTGDAHR